MSRDDALAEAGRKVMRYHFARMLSYEEGTRLGEDIREFSTNNIYDVDVAHPSGYAPHFEEFKTHLSPRLETPSQRVYALNRRALGQGGI